MSSNYHGYIVPDETDDPDIPRDVRRLVDSMRIGGHQRIGELAPPPWRSVALPRQDGVTGTRNLGFLGGPGNASTYMVHLCLAVQFVDHAPKSGTRHGQLRILDHLRATVGQVPVSAQASKTEVNVTVCTSARALGNWNFFAELAHTSGPPFDVSGGTLSGTFWQLNH
jgi:hypothetical protein